MSNEIPGGPPAPSAAFQQIDADAVCEQCGTVNEDGTLLCKVCGQNLRDQRSRRLASAQGPEVFEERISRTRILTGVLTVIGIGLVVFVVLSIGNIEAGLVDILSEEQGVESGSFWAGTGSSVFAPLLQNLEDYPTSRARIEGALENPASEQAYNGRYILLKPGPLDPSRVIGEANLSRRGSRVYFVATIPDSRIEFRGYAQLEEVGDEAVLMPVARNTASVMIDGAEYMALGYAAPLQSGGHQVIGSSDEFDGSGKNYELLAVRVR